MKKLFLLLALAAALPLHADDRIRDVQTELKTQGFYYGEINGSYSTETTAALRRYQIRNGLEVTGTLTDETTKSLGLDAAPGPKPSPAAPPPASAAPRKTIPHGKSSTAESDRKFLQREESQPRRPAPDLAPTPRAPIDDDAPVGPTPRRFDPAASDLPGLFFGTPYASAPREVQEFTLRRAQSQLADRGLYRDAIDGEPGPATEEALLTYQRSARLPRTGRLDLETLSALRLLPGRSSVPLKGFMAPRSRSEPPVYRGIWVR